MTKYQPSKNPFHHLEPKADAEFYAWVSRNRDPLRHNEPIQGKPTGAPLTLQRQPDRAIFYAHNHNLIKIMQKHGLLPADTPVPVVTENS
jgi:hypothetical protein